MATLKRAPAPKANGGAVLVHQRGRAYMREIASHSSGICAYGTTPEARQQRAKDLAWRRWHTPTQRQWAKLMATRAKQFSVGHVDTEVCGERR